LDELEQGSVLCSPYEINPHVTSLVYAKETFATINNLRESSAKAKEEEHPSTMHSGRNKGSELTPKRCFFNPAKKSISFLQR
jgi:hypothetical protein